MVATKSEASMKVPPKRKGNGNHHRHGGRCRLSLNESPSEKEGKFLKIAIHAVLLVLPQ